MVVDMPRSPAVVSQSFNGTKFTWSPVFGSIPDELLGFEISKNSSVTDPPGNRTVSTPSSSIKSWYDPSPSKVSLWKRKFPPN